MAIAISVPNFTDLSMTGCELPAVFLERTLLYKESILAKLLSDMFCVFGYNNFRIVSWPAFNARSQLYSILASGNGRLLNPFNCPPRDRLAGSARTTDSYITKPI